MRRGGVRDIEQRHLRAERNALRALKCEQRLGHQEAEHVRLVGHAGQQDARTSVWWRQAGDRLAQDALGQLGEQVFLEYGEAAVFPRLPDLAGERRHRVHDKTPESLASERLLQALLELRGVVILQQRQEFVDFLVARRGDHGATWLVAGVTRRKGAQRLGRQGHQLSGPMPLIDQALDQAQALDLRGRIHAVTAGVSLGCGEAVTPLPHAQGVLGQPGFLFDAGDRETNLVHVCL